MDHKQALGILEAYVRKMQLTADEHDNLNKAVKILAYQLGILSDPKEPVQVEK